MWTVEADNNGMTALHCAAENGHDLVVEVLLADPRTRSLVLNLNRRGFTALELAVHRAETVAGEKEERVMTMLLALEPADKFNVYVLKFVMRRCRDRVVSWYLAGLSKRDPTWVHTQGRQVLAMALEFDRSDAVKQLLALSPTLIDELDKVGYNALQSAVMLEAEMSIDVLLTIKPEMAKCKGRHGYNLLHIAALPRAGERPFEQVYTKLLQLNEEGLWDFDSYNSTPFMTAIYFNTPLADFIQWKLSTDEIVATAYFRPELSMAKFRLVIEAESGLADLLTRDVAGEVYEFLGFDRTTPAAFYRDN